MRKPCGVHDFSNAAAIFTGMLRTRACRRCTHVEVAVDGLHTWLPLGEYLEKAAAARRRRQLRDRSAVSEDRPRARKARD